MKIQTGILLGILALASAAQADPRLWGDRGIAVRQGQSIESPRHVAQATDGSMLVVWSEVRGVSRDIYAQLISPPGDPVWSEPVAVVEDSFRQTNPVAVPCGTGWIVAWEDERAAPPYCEEFCTDIYAQRLDMAGTRLWSANNFTGVAVETGEHNLMGSLQMAPDSQCGAYVVWSSVSGSGYALRGQRLTAAGTPGWGPAQTIAPMLVSNWPVFAAMGLSGELLVTWASGIEGSNEHLLAGRVTADGSMPWGESGYVIVREDVNWAVRPQICADHLGGCYIVWNDARDEPAGDIYAQRLNWSGAAQWAANGVAVCTAGGEQRDIVIAPALTGTQAAGLLAAWTDHRVSVNTGEIFGQRISPAGTADWPTNGVRICGDATPEGGHDRSLPSVTTSDMGGMICAWTDHRAETDDCPFGDLYANHVGPAGQIVWSTCGMPVADPERHYRPVTVAHSISRMLAVYESTDSCGVQRVSHQALDLEFGERMNGPYGQELTVGVRGHAAHPKAVPMSDYRTAVIWEDEGYRPGTGSRMLVYQIFNAQGVPLLPDYGRWLAPVVAGASTSWQELHSVCEDGGGGFFAAFQDPWNLVIRIAHVNAAGQVVSSDTGAVVWWQEGVAFHDGSVCADGAGGLYAAMSSQASAGPGDIGVMRLNFALQPMWAAPATYATPGRYDHPTGLIPVEGGGCLLVWQATDFSSGTVHAVRIAADGTVMWDAVLCAAGATLNDVHAVSDRAGGLYAAWTDLRNGWEAPAVYMQRVAANGGVLWAQDGVPLTGANQMSNATVDPYGNLLLVAKAGSWEAGRFYAHRIAPNGSALWPQPVAISSADLIEYSGPVLETDAHGGLIAAWIGGSGELDLNPFATHIDSAGNVCCDDYWVEGYGGQLADRPQNASAITALVTDTDYGFVAVWSGYAEGWGADGAVYAQRFKDIFVSAEERERNAARNFALHAAYPNPFNPFTTVTYELPQAGHVSLEVFDVLGRNVTTLVERTLSAGIHRVEFDGRELPSGIYICRLRSGAFEQSRKLVLLK